MGYWHVDPSGICSECDRLQAISRRGHRRPTCGDPTCVRSRRNSQSASARRERAGLGGSEGNCRVCWADIPFRPGKGMRPVTCWHEGNTCAREWTRRETKRFHDLERKQTPRKRCVICGDQVGYQKQKLCGNQECLRLYSIGSTLVWRHGRRINTKFCKICEAPLPLGQISLCGSLSCKTTNSRLTGEARRAGKNGGGGGTHTWTEWTTVLARFEGRCAYCEQEGRLGKEHVLPLARGGTNYISNLLPVCQRCNNRKRHRTLWEWSAVLAKRGLAGTRKTWWADSDVRYAHVVIERPTRPLIYSRTAAAAFTASSRPAALAP